MGIIIIQTQAPHHEALDIHALISSSCPFHREGNWIQEVKAFLTVTELAISNAGLEPTVFSLPFTSFFTQSCLRQYSIGQYNREPEIKHKRRL